MEHQWNKIVTGSPDAINLPTVMTNDGLKDYHLWADGKYRKGFYSHVADKWYDYHTSNIIRGVTHWAEIEVVTPPKD